MASFRRYASPHYTEIKNPKRVFKITMRSYFYVVQITERWARWVQSGYWLSVAVGPSTWFSSQASPARAARSNAPRSPK